MTSRKEKRKRRQAASTRELSLDLAEIADRYLLGTDHLHYGYWSAGSPEGADPSSRKRGILHAGE